jgi:hypothetical protein
MRAGCIGGLLELEREIATIFSAGAYSSQHLSFQSLRFLGWRNRRPPVAIRAAGGLPGSLWLSETNCQTSSVYRSPATKLSCLVSRSAGQICLLWTTRITQRCACLVRKVELNQLTLHAEREIRRLPLRMETWILEFGPAPMGDTQLFP